MTIYVSKAGLTYVSVPKCACSSLKNLCFEVEHGASFDERREELGLGRIHRAYVSQRFARLSARRAAGEYGGDVMTVIRNPVDRLLSCYSNKVVKAGAVAKIDPKVLKADGLTPAPTFDDFISNIGGYRAHSKVIDRHSRPLAHFLGPDPNVFAQIFDISEIEDFARLVNTRAGTHVSLPHLHRAGPSDHSTTVTHQTVRAIETYMADDYETFGNYMKPSNRICS